jgi:fatty acid/phospholipid biosynthesis enzyme
MVRAIELVKNNEAGVVVSCGNTGALMARRNAATAANGRDRATRPRRHLPARRRPLLF